MADLNQCPKCTTSIQPLATFCSKCLLEEARWPHLDLTKRAEEIRRQGFSVKCCSVCDTVKKEPNADASHQCSVCGRPATRLRMPVRDLSPEVPGNSDFEKIILSLSGKGFEDLLAAIFRSLGFPVEKTRTTGDFGVDLLLTDGTGKRIAVQAKRYKSDVGVSAVQEVYAGMVHYGCQNGILAIATKLTPQALQLLSNMPSVSVLSGKQIIQLAEQSLGNVLILALEAQKVDEASPLSIG